MRIVWNVLFGRHYLAMVPPPWLWVLTWRLGWSGQFSSLFPLDKPYCRIVITNVGQLRDAGIKIQVLKGVSTMISRSIEDSLNEALHPLGISNWNSIFWVVRLGGPAILDQV